MSWDVVLFNSRQDIKSVSELDEKQLEVTDFNDVLEHSFTEIKKEGNHREIVGEGFSIDYYASEPSSNLMLHLFGERAIYALIELAKKYGWQIYDSGIDSMIDLKNPKNNGYEHHQDYLHQISKNKIDIFEPLKYVSAIWGDEKKTVTECAERIYDFMQLLKEHNKGLFSEWYEQAMSLKKALECKVEPTQEYFYKQVEKNWDKKFPHLGSRVALWTGHKEDGYSAEISFSLGKYPNNPNIPNNCVITLPYRGEYAEYYSNPANQKALIRVMQEFWRPDFLKVNGKKTEETV